MQHHSPFGSDQDTIFMRHALEQAQKAFDCDEVPIGAIVVTAQGAIIGDGYNEVERLHSQTAHAECRAIERAGQALHDWRLEGCWIYVTLEPCSLCMNLIVLSRVAGVVFGAQSPLFGYHLDNALSIELYKKSTLALVSGVCEEESKELLKQFFTKKRKHKEIV